MFDEDGFFWFAGRNNDLFKVNRMADALDIKVCYPYLDRDVGALTGRIPAPSTFSASASTN